MGLDKAVALVEKFKHEKDAYKKAIATALPVGSLVDVRRGRSNTSTGGWSGPYEVVSHGWWEVEELHLKNLRTGKTIRWFISDTSIRDTKLGR